MPQKDLPILDTFTAARSQKSDFQISAGQTSLLGEENTRLQELDLEVVNLAADAAEPTRAERQKITMSELTVSSTNPSAAGTFTIEDSTGIQATVQASDLQAKFGQRTRVELNGVSSDVAIHASANTTTVGGVTSFVSATGALTMTVGSTNYSIDLTGVTAQNSAITTAIVSALQTASVGTSVSTFSVQDSTDTITPQREFKISSAGTSFQIQFTRQDETTTVSLTDNLNIFTSGATNLTTIRDYDNNQNAKSTARAAIDALVAGGEYEEVGAAKAQQIDFSGILVSAGAGTQVTLSLPTTSENAGGSVSVFASATMTAIDLARQFTDALIENDLAEEVPAFKKTFKDSNDNELRQVVDLGDGKIQIQFETTESTVGDVSLTDSGGNMGTSSTPSVSTDTIFTTREYSASQFGTPTYPDATTAKRQILDNDDGTFTIQFLTEDEDIRLSPQRYQMMSI